MQTQISIGELLSQAQHQLDNSASARLDAEVLLAFIMKVPRATFYAHPDAAVAAELACDFRSLVARREAGVPVAYLTGRKEFWSLELAVNHTTLIPRPETECLVETALTLIPEHAGMQILDLGTGSGAIAVAVASERPDCTVVAVDIIAESLAVARANARDHGLTNIRCQQSDWFSGLKDAVFDVILCNPPYVDSRFHGFSDGDIKHEPRIALDGGHQGLEIISHLIPASARHLKAGGHLVLEHGFDQSRSVGELFSVNHFIDVNHIRDFAGIDRVSYARLP